MKKKVIAPSEWEIMNIIWQLDSRTTVRQVLENKYPNGEKAYTTVQTIMNKLVKKGFLSREKIGMVNFYTVKKSRANSVKNETQNFAKRVFNGSFLSMANYLVKSGSLSKEEIQDLKHIIAENEKDK